MTTMTPFKDAKRPTLFTAPGKELRTLASGPGRLAITKAAKGEIARRKANQLVKQAS